VPIVLGAVVQLVGKPLCFMYPSLGLLAGARLLDRFAKGIRAAPTDALLADLSPTGQQGSVYGLYHSASTLGSIAGGIMVRHVAPPSPRGLGFRCWRTCHPRGSRAPSTGCTTRRPRWDPSPAGSWSVTWPLLRPGA
jgi:MFS family permease